MIIKKVRLVNFRNREDFTLVCEEKLTSILGENGCGKTSILEAIYEGLQGKSFRARDPEIVQRGKNFYRVEVEYTNGEKIGVSFNGEKKVFTVADQKYKRLPKQKRYPVVLFEPDDLSLVAASPSRKREYFDRFLGQLAPQHTTAVNKYKKSLTQANNLLKDERARREDLFSWQVMLAKYGVEVRKAREGLMQKINKRLTAVYRSIAENEDEVRIEYAGDDLDFSEEGYLARIEGLWPAERAVGHILFGAHRDSFEFYFNGELADGSASRGEVRSIIIALKFIEAEMIFKQLGKRPLILLDDVFSELDAERQQALMTNFRENQIVLTGVG